MTGRIKALASAAVVSVVLVGGYTSSLRAAEQANPDADCPEILFKDGINWGRKGLGWIRTAPAPGGGTDQFSMANYDTPSPYQVKTYNCSTGDWDTPPL